MTKSKTTKRALLASVLSLMLCMAMLVGSTFAWFTDTVKTAVNKIQSGKLDVSLQMKDADGNWVNAEGETLGWLAADGRAQEEILWEPGATYKLSDVRIINNGNLALKYKVIINGVDGEAKLLEAIEFTYGTLDVTAEGHLLPGQTSDAITITGHMKEDAGNEYQNLSIEGLGITVIATQYTYEQDSTDDQYDKNAEYPPIEVAENNKAWYNNAEGNSYTIKNGNELAYLAELVNAGTDDFVGKTITLANDIVLPAGDWVAIGTYDKPFKGNFNGSGYTVSNVAIHDNDGSKVGGFFGAIDTANIQNLTVSGSLTLGGTQGDSNDAFVSGNGGICAYANNSSITGCTNAIDIDATDRKTSDDRSLVVGGIVGFGNTTTVNECKNEGDITVPGNAIAGGITSIIGSWSGSLTVTINNSEGTGVVSGPEDSIFGTVYGVNTDE